jgi:O-antigen ligase
MIESIVFWGLCAVLILVPLPIASVEEWSIFAFEAAAIGLFLLYVGGRLFGRRGRLTARAPVGEDPAAPAWPSEADWDDDRGFRGRLPLFFKVLIGIFLAFSVLQVVPLPAGLVKVLSPHAYGIYAGLVKDAVLGPSSTLTLSLAPRASIDKLILMICYGLFGYMVLRTVRSRRRAEILVVVVLAAALFQAVYGLSETLSGHEMILGHAKRFGVGSVTGTFVNRNHFAGFLEMAFPLSLGYLLVKARYFAMEKGLSLRRRILWFGQESLQWTLLLGLVPVFIGVGLIFSKSRSGILVWAAVAVLAAGAAGSWRQLSGGGRAGEPPGERRRGLGGLVRVVVIAVLAVAVWIGIRPVIDRFSVTDISAEGRRTFYRNTIEMIGDFPLTGTGKGTYVNAYPIYEKVDDRLRLSFAHNDYLEYVAENGLIGGGALVLAGLGLLAWLALLWRKRRNSFAKGIGLGALLGVGSLFIHGFTDFNLQITANAVYFTTLAMLAAAVLSNKGERKPGPRIPDAAGANRGQASEARVPKSAPKTAGIGLLLGAVIAVVVLVPAVRDYLGYHHLADYRRARAEARSVENAFPALEARLEKAVAASPRAVFQVELARLYMDMAKVANDAGRDEDRDTFCDRAVVHYGQAIAANPIDAGVHYEMAATYLFYNFPLMTYQDRAKTYFREALAFKPADETINTNVLFLYFSWWPTLEDADRTYAAGLYRKMAARDPAFPATLEGRWVQSYGGPEALRDLIAGLPR